MVSCTHACSLRLLFGKHFENAVHVVDQRGVVCLIGETSNRRVYQVQSSGHKGKEQYTVFPNHYCSCQSFFFDIATKSEGTYVGLLSVFFADDDDVMATCAAVV